MYLFLLGLGIFLVILAILPYIIYYIGIHCGKKLELENTVQDTSTLPDISIIVCAYKEEKNIVRKIQNIEECSYPNEKTELVLVIDTNNDGVDRTEELAREALQHVHFKWQIHVNEVRRGKSYALNTAIALSSNNVLISSDADVVWGEHAVEHLVSSLVSNKEFIAGTGDIQPNPGVDRVTSMEQTYRSVFGRMAEWESAHDSTYSFNGTFLIFYKDMVQGINANVGADDANLAFEAIRKGYRTFYDSNAVVYEDLPVNLKKQYVQKIRRAKGLIQTTLMNRDLLRQKRPFSKVFYPLRFWMFVVTPSLLVFGFALLAVLLCIYAPLILLLGVLAAAVLIKVKPNSLFASFFLNQFYLLVGLYSRKNNAVLWESTSEKVQ